MADFLFEIGLEEVPARMIAGAEAELRTRVVGMLRRENLLAKEDEQNAKSFSTPRRLAVIVPNVVDRQSDTFAKVMGPAVKIAFKDGQPAAAAEAFARKNGVAVAELKIESTLKGEYLLAEVSHKGRPAAEVIAEEMPKELAGIYWAKNMVWRAGRPERFVRPVRWMLCLLEHQSRTSAGVEVGVPGIYVIPVQFGGKTAIDETYGHRVLDGEKPIEVDRPSEYVQVLEEAFVIADVEMRRQKIRKALDRVCRGINGGGSGFRWREDHALVDKLTHLTEWPTVIAGGFESEYLTLPEEVLVTVMRDHQSYFAVEGKDGKLAAHFLAVLNTETDAAGEAVIRHGNERVLRARFSDARFFWEFDQRVTLEERTALLEKVTFQKDLGSYAAKSARVLGVAERLASRLAERGTVLDGAALVEAVRLAKTDLTTELVKEFTELQGQVGGLYARAQGASAAVADAIYDQYLPKSMEDGVPRTVEGAVLALADKVDTIAGMFGLGLEPTGSKDPFALRRAANGIVKILGETATALPITLGDVVDAASASEAVRVRVEVFFAERLEFYLREVKGQAYDVVKAVLAAGANDVRDAVARAEAVTVVRGSEDFAAVSAAFKRMKNIVVQARAEPVVRTAGIVAMSGGLSKDNMHPAQLDLFIAAVEVGKKVDALREGGNYIQALETVATLRKPVDAFFEQVMVMDPDQEVRQSRLAMLGAILGEFSKIADFSEIVTTG